ncbi:class I SAM-dependent methyltransferase [Phragmitibacter flavus]|uniref:Class I SAM-dependent methyltransferase n=1 Tax=Phragmitibacter flavus TaxID=2576071 RepID=A0A5R8KH69_9BACT|nr:class I SAM-dependent methyltransferase [Phragmitibacter flavus]TLD71607.1 class I SAM-dependent methyltransferase [Phragmitibacter flavus]
MPAPSWRKPKPSAKKTTRPEGDPASQNTSWEKSADWYDRLIGAQGSELYQNVVIPGALKLLKPGQTKGKSESESILDLGCGQGVFTRAIQSTTPPGTQLTGVDLSPTLIAKAKSYPGAKDIRYFARDAASLDGLGEFDAISAILCIQNMPHLDKVSSACARILKPGGRMLWVLNHPAFRIPRQSSWGWEDDRKIQYRRLDAYSSEMEIPILMHPGQEKSESTVSFHHSLQNLLLPGFQSGLSLTGLEEWHSNKTSEPGPKARAENRARNEFPLFLALLWQKK